MIAAVGSLATVLALSGCGASTASPRTGAPLAHSAGGGTVSALFAGSLLNYMEGDLGPAFSRASGFGYQGYSGGSTELANEIRGGVRRGDVFISASAAADRALEGSAGGNWISWYSTFAASPLMLAYNPRSRFGAELAHGKPWYRVLIEPGVLVGRTDPKLDPKGVLTDEAVLNASRRLHDPSLSRALESFPVYPETTLVGRLQSGQLDAGFFYAVEASSARLPTVGLAPVHKYADYTVTVLNRAPDAGAAASLVSYLLNAQRSYALKRNGLLAMRPVFTGTTTSVPRSIRSVVGALR